jgi:hypothetical protein
VSQFIGLDAAVKTAIQERISAAKEEVIRLAVQEFEARIRKEVGQVAVNVANYYRAEVVGNELVIHVKIDPPPHKP